MSLSPQISVLLVTVLIYSLVPFTSAGIGFNIPYLSLQPSSRGPPTNPGIPPPHKHARPNPLQQQQPHLAQLAKVYPLLQQFMNLLPKANLLSSNMPHLKLQNLRPRQPLRQPQAQPQQQQQRPIPHQQFHQPQPQQQLPVSPQQFPQPKIQPNQQLLPAQSSDISVQHHFLPLHLHASADNGALYLHDPDSTVNFYFKENLHGPSKRVDVHHDGCREVPKDYWHEAPKSLWAKHCIVLYQNGHCKGNGVQVAGAVGEFRTAGFHYGITSFRPCEKNIRIRFTSPHDKKPHHDHHRY
ncbi:hypothetical protein Ocin01_17508 [Orchesella cincta]|uniref:Uncharacterized protein n=1 Tax=Orchesella cincta TaxID=48709 RepID=A0A1D2M887_ORCCI|nr:hypothetical protein Ocin01_17508 [Orchesella cincta]